MGCTKEPPPPTASSASPKAPVAVAPSAATAAPSSGALVLLRPGREPRRALRYRFTEGARTTWLLEGRTHAMSGGKGEPLALEATLTATVVDGAIEVVVDRSAVAALEGKRGRIAVSDRGRSGALTASQPLDDPTTQLWATLAEAVADAWVELPDAPVGEGARWRVTRPRRRGGVGLTRSATAKLVEAGEVVRVSVVVEEKADPRVTGDSPGLALTALAGEGQGTQQLAWATGAAFVTAAESTVTTVLSVRAEVTTPGVVAEPVIQEVATAQVLTLVSKAALDMADGAGQNVPDGG